MGEGDVEAEGEEAAERKPDEAPDEKPNSPIHKDLSFSNWRDEDGIERLSRSPEGSLRSSTAEGSEDFELPLLQEEGTPRGTPEPERRRSSYFRQRSQGNVNGKRFASFDVENGLRTSESMTKLELLEQTAQSSITAVMVLKTLCYILIWYTFSTCLTL